MPAVKTWIPSRKLWKKCYRGKQFSITTDGLRKRGLPCDDTERGSSAAAQLWWTGLKAEIDGANQIFAFDTGRKLKKIANGQSFSKLDAWQLLAADAKDEEGKLYHEGRLLDRQFNQFAAGFWQAKEQERLDAVIPTAETIGSWIDKYLDSKKGIVAKDTLRSFRNSLKRVGEILGRDMDAKKFDGLAFEKVSKEMAKHVSAGSLGLYWSKFTSFVLWLWDTARVIDELPRNFRKKSLQLSSPRPKAKKIPIGDLRSMLDAADDKSKLVILLGINCGFTTKPIKLFNKKRMSGNDEIGFIKDGRYVWRRTKTEKRSGNAPIVHFKLWKETTDLIGDVSLPKDDVDIRGAFNKVRDRLGIEKKFSQGSLRSTGVSMIFDGDHSKYCTWYLGDVDSSIAWRHYTAKESAEFQAGFDKCLDDLHDQIFKAQ